MSGEHEKNRYRRQMILPDWGDAGQEKIRQATVFVAGAGGLGSAASLYLAAAGIGCIRICDSDEVELSNLNRQILHADQDIGRQKVASARDTLTRTNPNVQVVGLSERMTRDNIAELVSGSDVIIDALDNFGTRLIVNEYVVQAGLPFIHAAIHGMSGQIMFIHPPHTPCLRCLFSESPPEEEIPVVGAAPGMIGAMQALETLKQITGIGTTLKSRLLVWEGDIATFEEVPIEKDPSCPVCSD